MAGTTTPHLENDLESPPDPQSPHFSPHTPPSNGASPLVAAPYNMDVPFGYLTVAPSLWRGGEEPNMAHDYFDPHADVHSPQVCHSPGFEDFTMPFRPYTAANPGPRLTLAPLLPTTTAAATPNQFMPYGHQPRPYIPFNASQGPVQIPGQVPIGVSRQTNNTPVSAVQYPPLIGLQHRLARPAPLPEQQDTKSLSWRDRAGLLPPGIRPPPGLHDDMATRPMALTPTPEQLSGANRGWIQQLFKEARASSASPGPKPFAGPHMKPKFRPMAALAPVGRAVSMDASRDPLRMPPTAFSSNYRGEHSIRNASVEDLPDELNCALWLTNLPPDVSHKELLACIRNIGRIWCTVINAPDFVRHNTAAAKVSFFTPGPAQRLLTQSLTMGLSIRGYTIKVTHNRVKYGQVAAAGDATRVLIITGQKTFVNEATLTAWFRERFIFEVDEVRTLIAHGNRVVIAFCFGSYRCQAQMGKMSLEKDKPEGFERVEFGEDPCEVGDSGAMRAYEIAARRIQGQ